VDIGALNLEEEDYEENVIAGFSVVSLTSTMKECWAKEVKEDIEYQQIVRKVTAKEENVLQKIQNG
jgi:uncharacterized protein involved in tolerance to divalent cations